MPDHIVKAYDKELESLGRKIAEMGGIAEKMLSDAMDALIDFDTRLAQATVDSDPRLDLLQRDIEEQAILTIARRQPMAVDLREIIATIRISGDLERIGDLAKNIAKRAIKLAGEMHIPRATIGLRSMHESAAMLLKEVLDAYAERDAEGARAVWIHDADLDALEDSVFPRPPHVHDGGSAQYLLLHASSVRFEKHRENRRSRDQHRRDSGLSRYRRNLADGPAQRPDHSI